MQLYILRHGIAQEPHDWKGPDTTRPLTPDGIIRTKKVLETLHKEEKLKVDAIWSSPLVRAQQTAAIAGEELDLKVRTVDSLACGANPKSLRAAFKKFEPLPERLMLVGHEPDCGLLISELSGDSDGDYALKKAGIALLKGDFAPGKMTLKWKLSPSDVLKD
jgi:phosphohistidine phosphatase